MSLHWKLIAAVSLFSLMMAAPVRASLVISSRPTQGVECASGVCTATERNAVLNVTDLTSFLAESGLSVESGRLAKNIVVAARLRLASTNMLTLYAARSILVDSPVYFDALGGLSLKFSANRDNGDLQFRSNGQVTFGNTSAPLTINGKRYVLVDNLAALKDGINSNLSGYFALANDYDASADGVYSSSPIPRFRGTLEGLGHKLSNLSINDQTRGAAVGLIGVQADGFVRDIALANVDIVGGVAGMGGAITGKNEGTIVNSFASGTVTLLKSAYAGGLVGLNFNTVDNCHADVLTTGGAHSIAGGLVGFNVGAHGTINRSSSNGNVVAQTGAIAGGLAGATSGRIWESFATGNTTGGDKAIVGGLTGYNTGGNFGRIIASYETGSVFATAKSAVGGLARWISAA